MSITAISRKLRRRYHIGPTRVKGVDVAAGDVVGRWTEERDKNVDRWTADYKKNIMTADTGTMKTNLATWYTTVLGHSSELREAVQRVYTDIKTEYRDKKVVPEKLKAVVKR
jgi:hypothetical protein